MEVISLGFWEILRHGELQASDFLELSGAQHGSRIVDKLLLHFERGIDPFVNSTPSPKTYLQVVGCSPANLCSVA